MSEKIKTALKNLVKTCEFQIVTSYRTGWQERAEVWMSWTKCQKETGVPQPSSWVLSAKHQDKLISIHTCKINPAMSQHNFIKWTEVEEPWVFIVPYLVPCHTFLAPTACLGLCNMLPLYLQDLMFLICGHWNWDLFIAKLFLEGTGLKG